MTPSDRYPTGLSLYLALLLHPPPLRRCQVSLQEADLVGFIMHRADPHGHLQSLGQACVFVVGM